MKARFYILVLLLVTAFSFRGGAGGNMLYAQDTISNQNEISQSVQYANDYLKHRRASVANYLQRQAKIQEDLLQKLNHIEHGGLSGLPARPDSPVEYGYTRHTIDFDSLQRLAADPSRLYNKGSPKANKLIDSLKGIRAFIQQQSGRLQQADNLGSTAGIPGDYSAKLEQLRQQLNAREQLQQLIEERSKDLQQQFPGKNIPALNRMAKQIAMAKAKTQSRKQLADDLKSYRINSKWKGTFMIGYNFLYQKYGLRTPLMIRIGREK